MTVIVMYKNPFNVVTYTGVSNIAWTSTSTVITSSSGTYTITNSAAMVRIMDNS